MAAFALFLLISPVLFNSSVMLKGETEEVGFTIKMSVTYHNNGTKNWIFTEEDRAIGLFMNNSWQMVQLMNHSYPLENTTFDEDGNPITLLQFPKTELKPGENISYTVNYYALSKPRLLPNLKEEDSGTLSDIPEELKESHCRQGDLWLVDDPELRMIAQNIAENETKVLVIVKKFVEWIGQNIGYTAHEVPSYPNETYTEGSGDCDDQAILFITLCRIYEIPSYLQVGCMYMSTERVKETYWEGHLTTSLEHIGWHGWAIVNIPPWGWLPVDLTWWRYNALDAIEKAAVTSQTTLQYMNISQIDYIASSRMYRDFLKDSGFYVYTQDEMMEAPPSNHGKDTFEKLFPRILIIATVVVAVIAAGISVIIWERGEPKEIESNHNLASTA